MKTEELLNKLSKKYPSPEYAFLSQVRNQTGYSNSAGRVRTADAMALGLWKSRGYYLHGFELKVSRTDWLKEMKDPSKAEAIAAYCDMFSLVISEESIIDISEVPKTWGILVAKNGTIKTIREAPLLKNPKPIDRPFLCGFLRNVVGQIDGNYIPRVEVQKQIEQGVKGRIEAEIYSANKDAEKYHKLLENIRKFQEESGIDLESMQWGWSNPEKIGKAVKFVMDGKHKYMVRDMELIRDGAKRLSKRVDEEIKIMEKEMGHTLDEESALYE